MNISINNRFLSIYFERLEARQLILKIWWVCELTLLSQRRCHKLVIDAHETDICPCRSKRPLNRWHHDQHDSVPSMVLRLDPWNGATKKQKIITRMSKLKIIIYYTLKLIIYRKKKQNCSIHIEFRIWYWNKKW